MQWIFFVLLSEKQLLNPTVFNASPFLISCLVSVRLIKSRDIVTAPYFSGGVHVDIRGVMWSES